MRFTINRCTTCMFTLRSCMSVSGRPPALIGRWEMRPYLKTSIYFDDFERFARCISSITVSTVRIRFEILKPFRFRFLGGELSGEGRSNVGKCSVFTALVTSTGQQPLFFHASITIPGRRARLIARTEALIASSLQVASLWKLLVGRN